MTEIELTNNRGIALVDAIDYEMLSQYTWHIGKGGYAESAVRSSNVKSGWTTLRMHRLVMRLSPGDGKQTDHINGNPLDNRRVNLRICTASQNQANAQLRIDNTSGYKGVSFDRMARKWTAYINVRGQRFWLGKFDNLQDAALAYNEAARNHHGDFAQLNTFQE